MYTPPFPMFEEVPSFDRANDQPKNIEANVEFNKEWFEAQKAQFGKEFYQVLLQPTSAVRQLIYVLEHLGKLSKDFDATLLLALIYHPSPDVRAGAVKNLGKLEKEEYLDLLAVLAYNEFNTIVKREIVSAIGRMRNKKAIPTLINVLQDLDSKIVLQAIRALLYFKDDLEVYNHLELLRHHPNEHVQDVISGALEVKKKHQTKKPDHPLSPDYLKNVFVNGDVRDILTWVEDESIHLTVTSPPYYNARDYQLYRSYEEYLQFLTKIFKELHRVTKEGRFFILNTSPVIEPRMSRAHSSKRYLIPFDIHPRITELGWEFIEDIVWMKPAPSVKNRNGGFFQHRKPLGYKANSICEYLLVYRKKTDKLLDWNMEQYSSEVIEASKVSGDYEKTNVWQIAPANDKVHPAVFPKELVTRSIQYYSMKGDLVFDPFGGVGTVAQAALSTERFFFLTEQEPVYFERAKNLLNNIEFLQNYSPSFLSSHEFIANLKDKSNER